MPTSSKKTVKKTASKKTASKKTTAKKIAPKTEEEVMQAEAEALTKSFKKDWKEKFHDFIFNSNHAIAFFILGIIGVISTITIIFVLMFADLSKPNNNKIAEDNFGMVKRMQQLKKSHQYYTQTASKDELLMSWVHNFSNWKYVTNGDPKYGRADCVGAVYYHFQKWESNIKLENVKWLVRRIKNLEERKEIKIRKKITQVKPGDIIIIQVQRGKPSHLGIVYETANGHVRYMDMNGRYLKWGLRDYKWGDWKIYLIAEVSFPLWIGDIIRTFD